ncbi:5-carboxymethyl-2-hydroxymuconate Delta-isomerase [Chitinimonas lacunae]|uniref:5-carboxymethyl-2-hydroxymuconate Delta-isomerase n=1 Tax=Chitinimonas lacunae TaxID=1963018 RepID=A0ABV8MWX3_9NEIS
MPHIVLEYSDNLPDPVDFQALFAQLHAALVNLGDVHLNEIKSRAIKCHDWRVGDGHPRHGFAHLKLYLLDRRKTEFKRRALAAMKPILAAHYPRSLIGLEFQLCLEIIDIRSDAYDKLVSSVSH